MELGLNETQQMLKTSARQFLEAECPDTYVRAMEGDDRGYAPEIWQKLAEQGWLGLIFPEEYGGVGFGFVEMSVLLEEMGRALLPGPFFSTVVLAGMTVMDAGNEDQKRELLPRIAEGQIVATLALTEPAGGWDPAGVQVTATADEEEYVINGKKLFVPDAHVSDYLIVAARTGSGGTDITLFVVPTPTPGVSQKLLKTIASDRQSEVVFDSVRLHSSALLGEVNGGWRTIQRVIQWAATGKCAEMVGGAQRVLEMTVEYAKQRSQFGRPIGSFQAIQHHCAVMATDVEAVHLITYQAASRLSEDVDATREVALAKAWVSDAYRRVCLLAHQCHGAIGFTQEHNLQLYTRRAKAAELAFGDSDFHMETVAQAIGL